jgi:cell shape-determining protein MreC
MRGVMQELNQAINEVVSSPKFAAIVSGFSVISYPAAALGLIQSWVSVVASVVGILLSIVLICNHIISGMLSRQELRLKIQKLESEVSKKTPGESSNESSG